MHCQLCSATSPSALPGSLRGRVMRCAPSISSETPVQVSDLRRLLEMYRLWQRKHFPLHGFDEALDQIADIGKTNQLKVTSSSCASSRLPAWAPHSMPASGLSVLASGQSCTPRKSVAIHARLHGICAGEPHRRPRSA